MGHSTKQNREYMRKYNATPKGAAYNRKHVKDWKKRNPQPSRITKGYRNMIVDFLLKRDGLVCGICSKPLEGSKYHINHIKAHALGGPDILENVNLTHPECNMAQSIAIRQEKHGY